MCITESMTMFHYNKDCDKVTMSFTTPTLESMTMSHYDKEKKIVKKKGEKWFSIEKMPIFAV